MADMLLIDLDNTIIDRTRGFERWAEAFLRSLGRLTEEEMTWLRSVDRDGVAARIEFFEQVRLRYKLDQSADALVASYQSEFPRFIPSPTDETLSALRMARKQGFKTCIVTNGSSETQQSKITSELRSCVDGWVISGELGVGKPNPAIVQAAATLCGEVLTPSSWMIGDRPETDVLCAWRAGISSVWITCGHEWDDRLPYRPTLEATSLAQAVERIHSLKSS